MNTRRIIAISIAILGLSLASLPAVAAKPGAGGSTDPCAAAGLDFPAFAFWRPSGNGIEILVADASGKCTRSVIKSSGTGGTIQFSYPVVGADGVTRGRVVWAQTPGVVAVDFTVSAGTNQISASSLRAVYPRTGGYISLSRDGNTLYTNNHLDSGATVINKVRLDSPSAVASVFTSAEDGLSFPAVFSVNRDETLIYADYRKFSDNAFLRGQLVWIPLDGTNAVNEIDFNTSTDEFTPAADTGSSMNRAAYVKWVAAGAFSCPALLTSDTNGDPIYPTQAAYGMKPTWVNGMIVADGFALSTRGGCGYTGTIMQTHPDTGFQTALVRGYDPDGK